MQGMPQWAPADSVAELKVPTAAADTRAWYLGRGDRQEGPHSKQQIIQMLQTGSLSPTDQVWTEGMAEWTPIHALGAEFADAVAASSSGGLPEVRTTQPRQGAYCGMAIASLIVSLIPLCGLNAPISIVFGMVAIQQIVESKRRLRGMPLAIAGIVVSLLSLVMWAAIVIFFGR
jgi:hypothetical protein